MCEQFIKPKMFFSVSDEAHEALKLFCHLVTLMAKNIKGAKVVWVQRDQGETINAWWPLDFVQSCSSHCHNISKESPVVHLGLNAFLLVFGETK
jgi:hypothetical protein